MSSNNGVDVFDWLHLQTYTGGDEELADEIIGLFIENSPGYLEAIESGEGDDWRASVHRFKGSARGIGGKELAEGLQALEKDAQAAAPGLHRDQALENISDSHQRLMTVLRTYQDKQKD